MQNLTPLDGSYLPTEGEKAMNVETEAVCRIPFSSTFSPPFPSPLFAVTITKHSLSNPHFPHLNLFVPQNTNATRKVGRGRITKVNETSSPPPNKRTSADETGKGKAYNKGNKGPFDETDDF